MQCPCGSGKIYANCCKKYHDGALPENALKLMKARYSAFAKNQLKFLYATLHPNLRPPTYEEYTRGIRNKAHYRRLIIRDFQDGETDATVTFTAYITADGKDATFTELSEFEKVNGQWLYKRGTCLPGEKQ
jgi:uncharacterized protein YchJ